MLSNEPPVVSPERPIIGASAAPARGTRLYLVEETRRASRSIASVTAGRTSISINGRWHSLRGRVATFEQLLRIAFPNRQLRTPEGATVSYRQGVAPASEGLLTPGDTVPLTEGLLVSAVSTFAS